MYSTDLQGLCVLLWKLAPYRAGLYKKTQILVYMRILTTILLFIIGILLLGYLAMWFMFYASGHVLTQERSRVFALVSGLFVVLFILINAWRKRLGADERADKKIKSRDQSE